MTLLLLAVNLKTMLISALTPSLPVYRLHLLLLLVLAPPQVVPLLLLPEKSLPLLLLLHLLLPLVPLPPLAVLIA